MGAPLLSIIIPAYNIERYIGDCINSVGRAIGGTEVTRELVEVICVDDGSSDGTLSALESLSIQYPWLTVLKQGNGGASSARNRGLDCARGTYVTFVDGDDYVEDSFFDELLPLIEGGKYDLVCFGIFSVSLSGEKSLIGSLPDVPVETDSDGLFEAILSPLSGYQGFSVGKVVRRELLCGDSPLRFQTDIRILEDEWFWLHAAPFCESVLLYDRALYDYRVRLDSATSTINAAAGWDDLNMRDRVVDYASSACPGHAELARWWRRLKCCSLARRFYLDQDASALARLRPRWADARKGLRLTEAPISGKQKLQVALCDAAMIFHLPTALLKPFRGFIGKGNERLAAEKLDSE